MEQEKVTFNLSVVDLGKMDYLVEHAFYANRSEFVRTAVRNQLKQHDPIVSDESLRGKMVSLSTESPEVRNIWAIGVFKLDAALLKRHLQTGTKLGIFVVGGLIVDRSITLETLKEVLATAKVYGSITGQPEVVRYLKEGERHV
ncbi:MAG: hypothetical protein DDT37_00246 [Firmicutes bacterium]|nr:hypothetical protein [candidate division NPL-UPA2 bacterium]MBT9153635.1 hypothetical protein [candidate division NPL-UPA2 bacterium]MBT9155279.1 hypothetical protein [candidate division NPL-UPA2 bacterium]